MISEAICISIENTRLQLLYRNKTFQNTNLLLIIENFILFQLSKSTTVKYEPSKSNIDQLDFSSENDFFAYGLNSTKLANETGRDDYKYGDFLLPFELNMSNQTYESFSININGNVINSRYF